MIHTDRKALEEQHGAEQLARAEEAVMGARMRLQHGQPFLMHLILRLPTLPAGGNSGGRPLDTMCTDGRAIYYSPAFATKLDEQQLQSVLAHEILHCVLEHHLRIDGRHPILWNIACDYAINYILEEQLSFRLPDDRLREERFDGWPAERIYRELAIEHNVMTLGPCPEGLESKHDGQTVAGDVISPKDGPDGAGEAKGSEGNPVENDWPAMAAVAAQAVRQAGREVPQFFDRLAGTKGSSKAWLAAVYQYMTPSKIDMNWKRPNRRFVSSDVYLPSVSGEQLEHAVLVVDTSGSVGPHEMALFKGKVVQVMNETRPKVLTLMSADTHVRSRHRITEEMYPLQEFPKLAGGGGTSFVDAINAAENADDVPPSVLIYLTDMYGEFPPRPPRYPVLWVATTDVVAPWGETVRIVEA